MSNIEEVDSKLHKELQRKLNLSKSQVNRRINKKAEILILTRRRAALALAAELGINIEKYSSDEDRQAIRHAIGQLQPSVGILHPPPSKPARIQAQTPTKPFDVFLDPFIDDPKLLSAAQKNAEIYPVIFGFENSVRRVVAAIMEDAFGSDWWIDKVHPEIKDKVTKRMKAEDDYPWHSRRGAAPIYYTDITDLTRIIKNNIKEFQSVVGKDALQHSLFWIEDIDKTRNVFAHHNPVTKRDRDDLLANARRWSEVAKKVYAKLKPR